MSKKSFIFILFIEDKFAVGSSARLISICYYEKENKWYATFFTSLKSLW